MISEWTQHIKDAEEKEKYKRSLIHSSWILEDLNKILDRIGSSLERAERNQSAYDSPNWASKQAHVNGFLQCINKIKALTTFDHKDTNERPVSG